MTQDDAKMDDNQLIELGRRFTQFDDDPEYQSDQMLKLPQPPLVKDKMGGELIDLPLNFKDLTLNNDIIELFYQRASHRIFTQQGISLLELSFLLWATQGIKDIRGNNYATSRTVPCGGARHEFETYLIVQNVEQLKPGCYHYLPMSDQLELLEENDDLTEAIDEAMMRQTWATKADVVFIWSLIPYRAEWRYGKFAHRVMMMDIGHVGENLYLACEALGLGTCGVGAFVRQTCDKILGLDGIEEYTVYASPTGTINRQKPTSENLTYKQKIAGK